MAGARATLPELEGFSDGLAVSFRHEIRKRVETLGKPLPRKGFFSNKKPAPCPACSYEHEIESGQVHLFSNALGEAEFAAALEAHPGLCLPHGNAALGLLKGDAREAFKKLAASKLEALCLELDEIVKKNDYRNSQKMGPEADAWKRALRRVYGPDYSL